MKALEKSNKLSIILALLILILVVTVLSSIKSEPDFAANPEETLGRMINYDYLIPIDEIDYSISVLIDTRNRYDYENGHLENAINIPTSDLLKSSNLELLDKRVGENKTIILYGSSPDMVNSPFILLYQLGYQDLKILSAINYMEHNKLITKNIVVEDSVADINIFLEKSVQKVEMAKRKLIEVNKPVTKKVVVKKKKKKMPVEGGC